MVFLCSMIGSWLEVVCSLISVIMTGSVSFLLVIHVYEFIIKLIPITILSVLEIGNMNTFVNSKYISYIQFY